MYVSPTDPVALRYGVSTTSSQASRSSGGAPSCASNRTTWYSSLTLASSQPFPARAIVRLRGGRMLLEHLPTRRRPRAGIGVPRVTNHERAVFRQVLVILKCPQQRHLREANVSPRQSRASPTT